MWTIILTLLVSPVSVADAGPVTMQVEAAIELSETTERQAVSGCERLRENFARMGKVALCSSAIGPDVE